MRWILYNRLKQDLILIWQFLSMPRISFLHSCQEYIQLYHFLHWQHSLLTASLVLSLFPSPVFDCLQYDPYPNIHISQLILLKHSQLNFLWGIPAINSLGASPYITRFHLHVSAHAHDHAPLQNACSPHTRCVYTRGSPHVLLVEALATRIKNLDR